MLDRFSRKIDYMRVSVTDRCNLRCRYCMPEGIETVSMSEILTYEEILDVAGVAAECGITKLKVTGGEPLVRLGVVDLVRRLKRVPGIRQVTMTTNGVLLAAAVPNLKDAGLDGVNVSLDTLDAGKFREITGFDLLDRVLEGIDAAVNAGLHVKVNAVLYPSGHKQEGINDGDGGRRSPSPLEEEWEALLEIARDRPVDVRFIELMPIGEGRRFHAVDSGKLLAAIREKYPGLRRDTRVHGNGPAAYVSIPGFQGGVGFISAVHEKFCGSCNRLRLTARGELKPCLCFADSIDLRRILRDNLSESMEERQARLAEAVRAAIAMKPEGHRFEDGGKITEPRRMVEIGG